MSRRSIAILVLRLVSATTVLAAPALGADYRGMNPGWPVYGNGAYLVPVRAAYANPSYNAAYSAQPAGYRAVPASYTPQAAYYAPQPAAAYYAPARANYAPANSYPVTPAGIAASGTEAAAYYGQPNAVNYVPPRFNYRPAYAAVPVYMYRPVTAYNPVTAQYSTCQQATVATTCQPQPQRTRCFSWFNPFTWFKGSSCGQPACGPAPTTAYCGTAACGPTGCGQPYYPVTPNVIPTVPAPVNVLPQGQVIPTFPAAPPAGPVIPSPPTRFQNVPGAIPQNTFPQGSFPQGFVPRTTVPADGRPSLAPQPGSTFIGPATPGSTVVPPGSFPINPTAPITPAPGFTPTNPGFTPTNPGAFGTGTNYPPLSDPYSSNLTPALAPPANSAIPANDNQQGPKHSVFGSGYQPNVIRAPELGPALPRDVQTVPDLDAGRQPQPVNRAPQLVDPRDKTALSRRDSRWAVVPAKWPTPAPASQVAALRIQPMAHRAPAQLQSATPLAPVYDDGGWKSSR